MIGAAPFLGGGLMAAGSGGGCPSPLTDSQDPASPSSSCSYGPSPGSGGGGNCGGSGGGPGGGGGTCSAPGGGNGNGGGGSGDSLDWAWIQAMMPLSSGSGGSMCCDGAGGGPGGGGPAWGGFGPPMPSAPGGPIWYANGWAVDTASLPQCDAPPGGPSPNPVPSSGGSTTVTTKAGPMAIQDLSITCVETGVTLKGTCVGVTFFGTVANMTYKTPGGVGRLCTFPQSPANYLPASVVDHNFTGTVTLPVSTV